MGSTQFRHVVVDADGPKDPHCKGAGNLTGDGGTDLVVASASGGGVFWYRHPDWSKQRIAQGSYTTDVAVADLDGDGIDDIVNPSYDALVWYRSPAARGADPEVETWETRVISPTGAHMHDVRVADLDGDGMVEIVTRHQSGFGSLMGNQVFVWKRGPSGEWHHRTFPCPHGEGLAVADITGNSLPDVVIGGRWYENPGDVMGGAWREHRFVDDARFAEVCTNGDVCVAVADLNGDGRPEIVQSPSEKGGALVWYESPDPYRPGWIEHVLDSDTDNVHALALGDVDGDGRTDIVYAKMHQGRAPLEVAVLLDPGAGEPRKHVVATTGSHSIRLVRVGAGRGLSIFGANWSSDSPTLGAPELWINEGAEA